MFLLLVRPQFSFCAEGVTWPTLLYLYFPFLSAYHSRTQVFLAEELILKHLLLLHL